MNRVTEFLRAHWKEIAGFAISVALLVFVFATADIGKVVQAFRRFPFVLLAVVFGLVAAREAARIVEWRLLLKHLGVRARWQHSLLALLSGDAAQLVPGGIYASNAVLKREEDANVARSLSATLATQLLEAFISLATLAVIGISGWPWMRWVAAVVLAGFVSFLIIVSRPPVTQWLDQRQPKHKIFARLVDGLKQFLQGIEGLMDPPLIAKAGGLAAVHLAFTIAALYVIVLGIGMKHIQWQQVAAIYSFVLAVINLNPLPTDLGVSEGSGMSVFVASGVSQAEGLTAMLLVRFAIVFSTAILLGVAVLVFRNELRHLSEGPNPADARANAEADPNEGNDEAKEDGAGDGSQGEERPGNVGEVSSIEQSQPQQVAQE